MTNRTRRSVALVSTALALVVPAAVAFGGAPSPVIRVAVEQTVGLATGQDFVDQLNDDTFFDFDAVLVQATALDSAVELAEYDVVVLGGTGYTDQDWTDGMAIALAAWAGTAGGGIVTTGWYDYDSTDRALLDVLAPVDTDFDTGDRYCDDLGSITFQVTDHPVTAGVTAFSTTSGNIEVSPYPPDATNAMVLGTSSDPGGCLSAGGPPNSLVVGELGYGRLVYVGLMYTANPSYTPGDLRSGPGDQLAEQAVAWAANDDDHDGLHTLEDNCPDDANADQADLDTDELGDLCDPDLDGDTIANASDNCPDLANLDQEDEDDDGIGDLCDPTDDGNGGNGGGGCGCTLAAADTAAPRGLAMLLAGATVALVLRRRHRH